MNADKRRCEWVGSHPLEVAYHDTEWGVPVHDDRRLFELLILEGAQAGLNWLTVLKKRESYREAFAGFDPVIIARFDEATVAELLRNPGIIRNRLKVRSAIKNAQAFLTVQEEYGTFDTYLWRFVEDAPTVNTWRSMAEIPAQTPASERMSKALKKRGFNFVGPTICYAFMQAVGLVNDHTVDCFRYQEIVGF